MKKKSDKELGVVLPEGMVDTINNRDLTDAQVGKIIRAITWNSMEYAQDDIVAKQLTTSLIGTYRTQNRIRITRIKMVREWKCESEKKRRERTRLAEEKLLQEAGTPMDIHGSPMDFHGNTMDFHGSPMDFRGTHIHVRTCETAERKKSEKERSKEKDKRSKDIPPIIPPRGDKKTSSAKSHARKRSHATKAQAPAGKTNAADKGNGSSPKKTGGRCRWMDAEGFCTSEKMQGGGFKCTGCENREPIGVEEAKHAKKNGAAGLWDGAAEVVKAAEAMMERHPNSKSSKGAVVRAIAATVEEEPEEGPVIVDAIKSAHAAWCETEGWAEDRGRFVQALAAWISNGGWRKPPPQKKKAPPAKGDEMSFDASL